METNIKSNHEALVRETASALEDAVKAEQPVTSNLVVTCLREYLRDEQAVAELARRSLNGENPFRALVRDLIHQEAEQIAQVTLARAVVVA